LNQKDQEVNEVKYIHKHTVLAAIFSVNLCQVFSLTFVLHLCILWYHILFKSITHQAFILEYSIHTHKTTTVSTVQ